MHDYKYLYFKLFSDVSDIIEELQKIQLEAEERYISADDDEEDESPLV